MAETSKSFIKKFIGFSLVPWITFAMSFISAPISTRLFTPEVLGKINIFSTYSNLIGLFILLGLDQAFARFYLERPNNRSKGYLFTFCFSITYALIFVFGVLSAPFSIFLSDALFDETDILLYVLMFVSVFCSATLRYLNLTYRMEQDIKMYTIQGVLMAFVSKVLHILVGFWDPSYRPALIVGCTSHLLLALIFLWVQRHRFERVKEYDSYFTKEMFAFALPLIPVSVLTWVNTSIPQVIMQKTMDYYSIGIFTSAMALANLILVIQSGFNSFWVPYTYENYKTQTGQFFKVHRYLMCVLTIFAMLMIGFQDVIFLLLGEKYRAAKEFFPFLILGPICYVAGEVAGVGIDISKKTYYKLYVFTSSIVANLVLCFILRIPLGVPGIAIATSLAAITAMLVKTYFGEKHYKVVTNYKYMAYCMITILASAAATLCIPDLLIRNVVVGAIFVASLILYRKEVIELSHVALSFIKKKQN